jgi:hypothetical protein
MCYSGLIGVSLFLRYWQTDNSLFLVGQIHLFVWAELLGVLLALASVVAFMIRAGYLLVVNRFRDAALDALFAGAAFGVFIAALKINPISG